ncbi:putative aldouronate transport system substrate-binding protein [Paenibacillus sp. UNCCL117]|uniref:ABC transporter substrate-binding protein n=1 Tax=unclassified Paenibacillus TaxID=185978 RepID=UPI00088983D1|nr:MULTISPECIES: ABC transporter substrate-binding protein [unclassified Paenibacillus]SDD04460.1 putative aldouronate transport system substrate-binding protein [Paenibacillus sp. cl123]SFW32074.1 putative aldouronate transport system substrate-binding protein [Paenibacillus sp. UNCCL117]
MKKRVSAVSTLTIGAMLFLSACGGNNTGATSKAGDAPAKETEKLVELNVAFPIFGSVPKDLAVVQESINKIAEQKIKATVKLTPISFGNWEQQVNLMLSSNEKLDLMVVTSNLYSGLVAKGQIVALDKLLEAHGQGIKKSMDSAYLNAAQIAGSTYAVPTIRDFAASQGLTMRKDLVDKYQIDVSKIRTLDDVEALLRLIKDKEPNLTPLVPGNIGRTMLDSYRWFDTLGDSMGVLPNYDNNLKVENLYETKEYADFVKKMRSWYSSGLILKDAATNKTSQFDLLKSNRGFGYFSNMKPGFEQQESKSSGVPVVTANLVQPVSTTMTVTNIMWGIPINSKTPEKAMEFLNLMYSDKEIVNLFDWGVEGKHYTVKADNMIDYPEGVDAKTSGYSLNMGYLFGNQFLSYVFNGEDAKIWEKMDQFNKSAIKSKALGFTFDASAVKAEYAAVSNVVTQYKLPLETGSVDPEKTLPEFISKLKSAGIDKIIAEKQKQLDAWAKSSK